MGQYAFYLSRSRHNKTTFRKKPIVVLSADSKKEAENQFNQTVAQDPFTVPDGFWTKCIKFD